MSAVAGVSLAPDCPRRVLIVLHQEASSPGRVGQWLQARGFCLDIRRPRFGDPLPATMADHAGAVIFGGPMSANDDADYVKREIDWINVPLAEGKPFLGICLGAQMMVRTLGGKVFRHAEGHSEIGYYPLFPTETGKAVVSGWPQEVYHWHSEGFELPSGGELLAEGHAFPNQAYRVGTHAYGIQFHPEVTWAMMNRWTVLGASRLSLPNARARSDHFAGRAQHDLAAREWLDSFLCRLLGNPLLQNGMQSAASPARAVNKV